MFGKENGHEMSKGPHPDSDDFSAGRFAPLPREPIGCFAKGMELSPILSAGADWVGDKISILNQSVLRKEKPCLQLKP